MPLTPTHKQYGAPRHWRFAGRDWPVSGLTPYQLGLLDGYLRDSVPSPIERVRELFRGAGDTFTPEERARLIAEAKVECEPRFETEGKNKGMQIGGWPSTFYSRDGEKILLRGAGVGFLLWAILSKHSPDLTRNQAEAMATQVDSGELESLMALLQVGDEEEENDERDTGNEADDDLPEGYVDPKK